MCLNNMGSALTTYWIIYIVYSKSLLHCLFKQLPPTSIPLSFVTPPQHCETNRFMLFRHSLRTLESSVDTRSLLIFVLTGNHWNHPPWSQHSASSLSSLACVDCNTGARISRVLRSVLLVWRCQESSIWQVAQGNRLFGIGLYLSVAPHTQTAIIRILWSDLATQPGLGGQGFHYRYT